MRSIEEVKASREGTYCKFAKDACFGSSCRGVGFLEVCAYEYRPMHLPGGEGRYEPAYIESYANPDFNGALEQLNHQ